MADRIESLLSLAGLGSDRDATTTSTSLARSTSAALASVSSRTSISPVTSLPAISTSTTLGRSTIGPVQATTVRSTSSVITTTVARSTSSVISTTSARSTTSVRSTSASSSSARSVSVTTLTSTSSVMPSSTSSSSSIIRTSSASVGVPPASATASAGAEDGFKMSGGIIAAVVIASLLAFLALLLVGYRYYRRRSRANSRRISGLSAWAGQRQSQAGGGGWDSGEDRWGKQEEGVGKWEGGEKERVSPFPINASGQPSLGYEQGYEPPANGYPHAGYPPAQPQYAPQQAYDNYNAPQAYHQAPAAVPYQEINKNLPLPPQPVGMGQPETQLGWMPGTPHTFGSFASNDGVNPSSVSHRDDPLAAARATGLHDGAEVVVKQGFIRSLDDELVITVGEKLVLVQAYDDGWSLCEKVNAGHEGMVERGVVPLNCLEAFSGASVAEESVSMPQPAMVGHIGKPEMEQLDGRSSPIKSPAGQEYLAMPSPSKAGKMTRSSTAQSLAVSERSERRSSLFINAAAAGLWLQTQPAGAARP